MTTATETLPDIDKEITEPDGRAHYVRIRALLAGGPVVALCGKKWIPETVARAGERPLCLTCDELMAMLEAMSGDSR